MNYRPVSNLSYLSKSLERVVQRRLQEFLDSNHLMLETQSAYHQYHSTETVVTKVYNDLLLAADQGGISALCLLDLTAAFDTADHDLLMLRLERQFGLRGVLLEWFSSYLSDRTFQVVIRSGTSSVVIITCSVPTTSTTMVVVHPSCLDSPPHSLFNSSLSSSPLSSSITPSLFHSRLKTYLFNKSFPP